MTRIYTIPGIVTARIVAERTATTTTAYCRLDGKQYDSLTRPAGCEEQAIGDVRDALDRVFASFGRKSRLA